VVAFAPNQPPTAAITAIRSSSAAEYLDKQESIDFNKAWNLVRDQKLGDLSLTDETSNSPYFRAIGCCTDYCKEFTTDGFQNRYKSASICLRNGGNDLDSTRIIRMDDSCHQNPRKTEHLKAFRLLAAEAAKRTLEQRMALRAE